MTTENLTNQAGVRTWAPRRGPAATAAARVSRASLGIGAFGLAAAVFVITRAAAAWRLAPAAAHHVSIGGLAVAYPVANFDAIVVLLLAGGGLAVTALAVVGAAHELAAARRFARRIGPTRCQDGAARRSSFPGSEISASASRRWRSSAPTSRR